LGKRNLVAIERHVSNDDPVIKQVAKVGDIEITNCAFYENIYGKELIL
jgi:hypothetical protein